MTISLAGFILTVFAALVLSVGRNWRWSLLGMAGAQLGMFFQIQEQWPLEQAAIALVGGWMALAVLGASKPTFDEQKIDLDAGYLFRFLVFILLLLVAWSSAAGAVVWVPGITFQAAVTGLLLTLAGLVRSGMVKEPLQVVLSVLMVFAGFEVLYAAVETSALISALLAAANLCLSLVGAYLSGRPLVFEEAGQ